MGGGCTGHADYSEAVEEKFRSMAPEEAMTDDEIHAFDEVAMVRPFRVQAQLAAAAGLTRVRG